MRNFIKILFFAPIISYSQNVDFIYTLDNKKFAPLNEFVKGCASGFSKESNKMQWDGFEIEPEKFCKCIATEVIANNTMDEVISAMNMGNLLSLIDKKGVRLNFSECILDDGAVTIDDDFKLSNVDNYQHKEISINYCMDLELKENPNLDTTKLRKFCECKREKLIQLDLTFNKLYESENTDKEAYNEIIMPCLSFFDETKILYNPDDIVGEASFTILKLLPFNNTYRLKIDFNGQIRYLVFDTGADQLIINEELEKILILKNIISPGDYIDSKEFLIADGSTVEMRGVKLSNIIVGNYKIKNVDAYISKYGGMLCGMGFLNKFRKWEIEKEKSNLILYK